MYSQIYADSFALSVEELAYLNKKKNIYICIDPNWMPYDALIDNKHVGINSHFLTNASKKIGIPMTVLPTKSWEESQTLVKEGRCDLLSLPGITEERKSYLRFTDPYFDVMIILATIGNEANSIDILALKDEPIGIVSNHTYRDKIETTYQNLNLIKFKTLENALQALKNKKIYTLIENLPTIGYEIQKGNYEELRVSGILKEKLHLGFGVRSNDKILFNIMQKVSKSFDMHQKQEIQNRWFAVRYEKQVNKKLLYNIMAGFTFVLFLFLLRYIIMHQTNKKLSMRVKEEVKKSQEKDRILFEQNKFVAMGEMIENISHQWRQPLAEINASVMLIDNHLHKYNIIDRNIEQELSSIEYVTKYMSRTIDDFRYFYRRDKGKMHCDIQESLRCSISIVKASLQFHKINLEINNSVLIVVDAYCNELQQAIMIILNNAKDVLVERQIIDAKITIDFIVENDKCILRISDNGGGIIPANVSRVCEPYFTTKHQLKGSGLGLYIANNIIKGMNGRLDISNSSIGACFKIELQISEDHAH